MADRDDDDDDDDDGDFEKPRKKKKSPSKDEKQMAMFCHLGGILGGFLIPLVIWMMKKEESRFIDRHGKEALNFAISMFIYHMIMLIPSICTFGLLSLVVVVIQVIFHVQAGMAASRGEYYEYPMCIRMVK